MPTPLFSIGLRPEAADLFLKSFYHATDTDSRVELLNNYWQELWRTASADLPQQGTKLPPAFMQQLQNDMDGWWDFHTRYFDAVFKRALDPRDLWGGGLQTRYEEELGNWKNRFLDDLKAMLAAAPKPVVAAALSARNVDPDMQFQQFPASTNEKPAGPPAIVWGAAAAAVLVGFGIWASHTSTGYRRSQRYYSDEPRFRPRSRYAGRSSRRGTRRAA